MTRISAAVAVCCLVLTGCGDDGVLPESPPKAGPIESAVDHLSCAGPVFRKGAGDYADGGLERVGDSPEDAWAQLVDENDPGEVPHDLRVVNTTGERALLTFTGEDGRIVAAAVAADGTEDWDGGSGWGIESWAVCDPSALPARVTAGWWIHVWERADGTRVPTTDVYSYEGPEHCDWQALTFLELGDRSYLRDPDGLLAEHTEGRFRTGVDLPADAQDTGFRRAGRELWTVAGRGPAYLVSVKDRTDVEAWPRAQALGCA